MNVFPFIEAEKADQGNVAKACALLEVSRSAFYEWSKHRPSARHLADEQLAECIQSIYDASRGTYGWPRVHQALRRDGVHVGAKRVARIMRQRRSSVAAGAARRARPSPDPDTRAADLVKRAFGPGTVELDRIYVGDITYIWTWEGWLYLATVVDLASRRVVGCTMADHMRAELVCDALNMAVDARRQPAAPSSTPTAAASTPRPSSPTCWRSTTCSSHSPGPGSAGTTPWPRAGSPR